MLEAKRRAAVAARLAGMPAKVVAEAYGVHPSTLSHWCAAFREHGDAGLTSKPHPGRKPKLDADATEKLCALAESSATEHGFDTPGWHSPRLQRVMADKHGVKVHASTIRRSLKRNGFTRQTPEPLPRERIANAEKRAEWIDNIDDQLRKHRH